MNDGDKRYRVEVCDCLAGMKSLSENSIDSIVTDPPYGLEFMGKEWDAPWKQRGGHPAGAKLAVGGFQSGNGYSNRKTPTYGKPWSNKRCIKCNHIASGGSPCECTDPEWVVEHGNIAAPMRAFGSWCEEWASEALRVAKPGAHLLAFGGTRTYHRLACAIEDAGWEIRDCVMWVYGSGFPKSMDVSKAIDKTAGADREVIGTKITGNARSSEGWKSGNRKVAVTAPATEASRQWEGWGTALKPAYEPIIVARKPLCWTVAENVLKHGTGAIHVDACRVKAGDAIQKRTGVAVMCGTTDGYDRPWKHDPIAVAARQQRADQAVEKANELGRFPANLIHDGSDKVMGLFPHTNSGSAARFFYCVKASKADRGEGNIHPTVKPTALMRYLCKLVTQPNGVILDPFMGSGSTGKAAMLEGFRFIGMEMNEEYANIGRARIAHALETRRSTESEPNLFEDMEQNEK